MAIKRSKFTELPDPPLYDYTISREVIAYDADTADVVDELLFRIDLLMQYAAGGFEKDMGAVVSAAYGLNLRDTDQVHALVKALKHDCAVLLETAFAMAEIGNQRGRGGERRGLFNAMRKQVPALHEPTDTELPDPHPATTA